MNDPTPLDPRRRRSWPISIRHPLIVIAVAVAVMAISGVLGGGVADELIPGGFEDLDSESARAAAMLDDEFDAGVPDLVVVVDAGATSVDDAPIVTIGNDITAELAARADVEAATSYWALGSPPTLSANDGTKALILVRLTGDDSAKVEAADEIRDEYDGKLAADPTNVDLGVAGPAAVFSEVNETVESDLVAAELIALPVTALLLLLIFGSVTAAVLPLLVGGFSIVGTFLALDVIAGFTDVSIFALNFTTAIGLGLAIDYALLIVNRFREELAAGRDVKPAVAVTVATAGRTVMFSGLTVASALAALLVFPFTFLQSFAWAGFAVIGLAVIGAVVVLPAILTMLGHRINRLAVRRVATPNAADDGVWHRIATTVMRRPVPIATAAIAVLLLVGSPFLRLELGQPDDRVLEPGATTREVSDLLRTAFDAREQSAMSVVLPGFEVIDGGDAATSTNTDQLAEYANQLSLVDGVARVDSYVGSFADGQALGVVSPLSPMMANDAGTYLSVVPDVEPVSPEAKQMVDDLRAVESPAGERLVGGSSAVLVDTEAGLMNRLPLALGLIALITFGVLFMAFGSVLMPVKAILLNLLSLSATLGAMVWIYQDGRLEDLLGFTATGTLNAAMPVLMFVIAFGLSMDYEVFLLSRVREEWLESGDPVGSVAMGLERTGRIVTAAAALMAVVFVAFGVTASVRFMSMFGFGMALAILVDAFIVRTTLVPAFMRLAGGANWWAPAPLRRFHDRFGFSETGDIAWIDELEVGAVDPFGGSDVAMTTHDAEAFDRTSEPAARRVGTKV